MSMPLPLYKKHNRDVWRKTLLEDKKDNSKTCTCFFQSHARDFALECLDELDKAYEALAAEKQKVERMERVVRYLENPAEDCGNCPAAADCGYASECVDICIAWAKGEESNAE